MKFKERLRHLCTDLFRLRQGSESNDDTNIPKLRSGTNDALVWRSVVTRNEYFVPETLSPEDVVIDIGLHIGSFSYLALTRGAGRVYGFEADDENCTLARRNLQSFGERISIVQAGVCRSDSPPTHVFFSGYKVLENGILNTGGGDVLYEKAGRAVRAVPFDSIVDFATMEGRERVRLLKLDCEGSEYAILMTSNRLHLIDEIVGEYHEIGRGKSYGEISSAACVSGAAILCGEMLADHLRKNGFVVRLGDRSPQWGIFLAWNRNSLPVLCQETVGCPS